MGERLFCTSQAFYVCKSKWKRRCNRNDIRAAGSSAICQTLMSVIPAVEKPRDK